MVITYNYKRLTPSSYLIAQKNNRQNKKWRKSTELAMTSEIRTKGNLWRRILGEIFKEFFVTVEIQRCPGWNIFRDLINGGCGIRMSWLENFLKINKRGETSIRDLRVVDNQYQQTSDVLYTFIPNKSYGYELNV